MRLLLIASLVLSLAGSALAQGDPGTPDTVRLNSVALSAGKAAIEITFVNDRPVAGVQIPLAFSGDLVLLDSVSFGARTAGFAGDDIVRWEPDLGGTSRTVMIAVVPLQTGEIAAGSDVIATLHFSQNPSYTSDTSNITATTLVPAGGLLAADTAAGPNGYQPVFVPGVVAVSTLVADRGSVLPKQFELLQNFPNPFNPSTALSVALPEPAYVVLDIYNLLGQRVRRLYDGSAPAGYLDLIWDGRDQAGRSLGSGVYFYRVSADDFSQVRKMVLLK